MSLPGKILKLVSGSMCDDHDDRLAVICIQGETDSFGHEEMHMCQECYDLYNKSLEDIKNSDDEDNCDWCKGTFKVGKLQPFRDWTEGSNGPVYTVCPQCRQKSIKDAEEELDYYDNCN